MYCMNTVLILFLVSIASFIFDAKIVALTPMLHHPILTVFFLVITKLEIVAAGLIFASLIKKKNTLPLWSTVGISYLCIHILKLLIQRPRPEILPLLQATSFSFPSGHAAVVFAALPFLNSPYWLIFAVLVSFSRIYLGVHYLSDVLFGALIGYFIGLLIKKKWRTWFQHLK